MRSAGSRCIYRDRRSLQGSQGATVSVRDRQDRHAGRQGDVAFGCMVRRHAIAAGIETAIRLSHVSSYRDNGLPHGWRAYRGRPAPGRGLEREDHRPLRPSPTISACRRRIEVSHSPAGTAIGEDHHHRLDLAFRQQIVDHVVRVARLRPFGVGAADAVQQIKGRGTCDRPSNRAAYRPASAGVFRAIWNRTLRP